MPFVLPSYNPASVSSSFAVFSKYLMLLSSLKSNSTPLLCSHLYVLNLFPFIYLFFPHFFVHSLCGDFNFSVIVVVCVRSRPFSYSALSWSLSTLSSLYPLQMNYLCARRHWCGSPLTVFRFLPFLYSFSYAWLSYFSQSFFRFLLFLLCLTPF